MTMSKQTGLQAEMLKLKSMVTLFATKRFINPKKFMIAKNPRQVEMTCLSFFIHGMRKKYL